VTRAGIGDELFEVIDMTEFVSGQRELLSRVGIGELRTPVEQIYVSDDVASLAVEAYQTLAPPSA
jgi:hypothetical protein